MNFGTCAILTALAATLACGDDHDPLTSATASAGTTANTTANTSSNTTNSSASSGNNNTSDTGDTSSASATGTSEPTTGAGSESSGETPVTTSGEATGTTGDETTGTTAVTPPEGPGVFPGESGLEAFCRRYVECGGTYYADQQACIDASYDYWGDCPSRKEALDVFGACMADMECTDWSPDAYNPNSTPCAEQWGGVGGSEPCP